MNSCPSSSLFIAGRHGADDRRRWTGEFCSIAVGFLTLAKIPPAIGIRTVVGIGNKS